MVSFRCQAKMVVGVVILLAFGIIGLPTACTAQAVDIRGKRVDSNAGVTAFLQLQTSPAKIGSPIFVTLSITNTGETIVPWESWTRNTPYLAMSYDLTFNGVPAQRTAFDRRLVGQNLPDDPIVLENQSSILFYMAPGQVNTFNIDISKLYEIKSPGVYVLNAQRGASDLKNIIRAKPLSITVEN